MLEEKVIASWKYTKARSTRRRRASAISPPTRPPATPTEPSDLAGARAAGASEAEVREAISFAIRPMPPRPTPTS